MRLKFVLLSLGLIGCGADGSDEKETSSAALPHSLLVANDAALPDCTSEAEGWLVYVSSTKTFKACQAGAWAAVEAPAASSAAKLSEVWSCGESAPIIQDATFATIGVNLSVKKYSDGSYVATCASVTAFDDETFDWDAGTDFYSAEEVSDGTISCYTASIVMSLKLATKSAVYQDVSDESLSRSVECAQPES